jgi:hypothetical protein
MDVLRADLSELRVEVDLPLTNTRPPIEVSLGR